MAEQEFAIVNRYEEWLQSEGIPIVRGFFVEDLYSLPLARWPRKGGLGAYINLDGTSGINNAYVCEIPPGASLAPQRHLFEEVIFVLNGAGATSVWQQDGQKHTFEWGEGSLFAIPLNAWHQHFNGSTAQPARYVAVTSAPLVVNLFRNLDFVFGTPFTFEDRFSGQPGYFASQGTAGRVRKRIVWQSNFVPDVMNFELPYRPDRGKGYIMHYAMAETTLGIHVAEQPVGTYLKAHRHGPGAHIVILQGKGYSLLWREGDEKKMRVNWKPGSMFVPPDRWFHQHFNIGDVPVRHVAVHYMSQRYPLSELLWPDTYNVSTKVGGDQIEYEDEEPEIRRTFEAELAKSGVKSTMPPVRRKH